MSENMKNSKIETSTQSEDSKCYSKVILTINNFSKLDKKIFTEKFKIGSYVECCIALVPFINFGINYLKIKILPKIIEYPNYEVKYWIRIKDGFNEEQYENEFFGYGEVADKSIGWGYQKIVSREVLLKTMINRKLTLILDIHLFSSDKDSNEKLKELFKSGLFSDFRFIVKDKEFLVHRMVLSLYSSVFKRMFTIDMKEKEENCSVIEDIDRDVFEEFLKYLYLKKLDKMSTMAVKLLYVSEKYQVLELKNICEDFLEFDLNIENAIEFLTIANNYNLQNLKKSAVQFIAYNMYEIQKLSKNEMLDVLKTNPFLANDINQVMANRLMKDNTTLNSQLILKNWNYPKI